jgi:hypothetical protein
MTFEQAAKTQYLRSSFYTVWLIGPNGERESLGSTNRKSGRSLIDLSGTLYAQKVIRRLIPNAEDVHFKKTANALVLSNGWRIEFGGTIRQEATG